MTVRIFVSSDLMAPFHCPQCGKSRQKDVTKFIQHKASVRLKYTCKCKHSFSVVLERRQTKRKAVSLKGFVIKNKTKYPIIIEDISKQGIKINALEKLSFKEGDIIDVEFILDDQNNSEVRRKVKIKKMFSPYRMGCEFLITEHYDSLGKYFLFYFENDS